MCQYTKVWDKFYVTCNCWDICMICEPQQTRVSETCLARQLLYRPCIFWQNDQYFNLTEPVTRDHLSPVLTDHIFVANGVVFQDRFYCSFKTPWKGTWSYLVLYNICTYIFPYNYVLVTCQNLKQTVSNPALLHWIIHVFKTTLYVSSVILYTCLFTSLNIYIPVESFTAVWKEENCNY